MILTTIPAKTIMSNNFAFLFMDVSAFLLLTEGHLLTHGCLRVNKLTDVDHSLLFSPEEGISDGNSNCR